MLPLIYSDLDGTVGTYHIMIQITFGPVNT